MFDRTKFLPLLPSGDQVLDDAIERALSLLDDLSGGQTIVGLVGKAQFQCDVMAMRQTAVADDQRLLLRELIAALREAVQQHQRRPFITGRGLDDQPSESDSPSV